MHLDFLTTSFLFLAVTMAFFEKNIGQVLAWESGLKVPLLPLRPSLPLQIILLSDLVCRNSPQVITIWHTFLKI
jgi:hypothetical protein